MSPESSSLLVVDPPWRGCAGNQTGAGAHGHERLAPPARAAMFHTFLRPTMHTRIHKSCMETKLTSDDPVVPLRWPLHNNCAQLSFIQVMNILSSHANTVSPVTWCQTDYTGLTSGALAS